MEATIETAIEVLLSNPHADWGALIRHGFTPPEAWRLYLFLPIAFVHVVFRDSGATFEPTYLSMNPDTMARSQHRLADEPLYLAGMKAAERLLAEGYTFQQLLPVLGRSAEYQVLCHAGFSGSDMRGIRFVEPLLTEFVPDAVPAPVTVEAVAYEAFRDALNALKPGWEITDRGIAGPGRALVRLDRRHNLESDGHLDVQFLLDEDSPRGAELWDCVTGYGPAPADRARHAAYLWSQTTAGALFEFKYSRRGEFAAHYHGAEQDGLRGWHVIHGAIGGFPNRESVNRLQHWWFDNPVQLALSPALSSSLDERSCPHGIKILFGGDDVAEVRIDGELHEAASAALADLGWPRLQPRGFVRSYVLVLHREAGWRRLMKWGA